MKIRIVKKLNERDVSPSAFKQYNFIAYYNKFLNPDAVDYLFNKKIILYDLETKGLLPSPYIHQFAALEFDLSKPVDLDPSNMKADDAFIAKCYYSYQDFNKDDASFKQKRKDFYENFRIKYFAEKKKTFSYLFNDIKAILLEPSDKINMAISKHNMPILFGQMVFGFQQSKPSLFLKPSKQDKAIKTDGYNVSDYLLNFLEVVKDKYENDPVWKNDSIIRDGYVLYYDNYNTYKSKFNTSNRNKRPIGLLKFIYNTQILKNYTFPKRNNSFTVRSNMRQDPKFYKQYADFWNFLQRIISNYQLGFAEAGYYDKYKPFVEVLKKIKNDIGMSYSENVEFTNYKTFPLQKYVSYNDDLAEKESDANFLRNVKDYLGSDPAYMQGATNLNKATNDNRFDTISPGGNQQSYNTTLVSEKYALKKFLEWFGQKKDDGFLLMGQNIRAFDNKVIEERSKFYGLQNDFVNSFFDSKMFDTLPFFRNIFIPIMKFFEQANEDIPDKSKLDIADKQNQKAVMDLLDQAQNKLDEMREMYPSLRAKLDGLMVMFYGTNRIQTHTADDDCEQLLAVFLPAFNEVKNLIHLFGDGLFNYVEIMREATGNANYDISLGFETYKIPEPKQTKNIKLQVGEVDRIASKLSNDILIYSDFDSNINEIKLYGNKSFDKEFPNFVESFTGTSGLIYDIIKPTDEAKVKNEKKYPNALLDRLHQLLKVYFKNYIVQIYDRHQYNDLFNLMNFTRDRTIAFLKEITKFWQLPADKRPAPYTYVGKYANHNFYTKHNVDPTAVTESKRKINIKIIKG